MASHRVRVFRHREDKQRGLGIDQGSEAAGFGRLEWGIEEIPGTEVEQNIALKFCGPKRTGQHHGLEKQKATR